MSHFFAVCVCLLNAIFLLGLLDQSEPLKGTYALLAFNVMAVVLALLHVAQRPEKEEG